jgi:hypothetical protein
VLIKTGPNNFKVIGVHKGYDKQKNSSTGKWELRKRCVLIKTIQQLNPNFEN